MLSTLSLITVASAEVGNDALQVFTSTPFESVDVCEEQLIITSATELFRALCREAKRLCSLKLSFTRKINTTVSDAGVVVVAEVVAAEVVVDGVVVVGVVVVVVVVVVAEVVAAEVVVDGVVVELGPSTQSQTAPAANMVFPHD